MDIHFKHTIFFTPKALVLEKALIFLFVIILIPFCQAQQYPVTITITVSPPYPPKVNEYIAQPNKIMATLINTSAQVRQIYVQGTITGEGSIKVYTDPNYKMPQPLILQPGIPFQMNQGNIQQVFSSDYLVYQGISKNEILYGTGLPEGNYTICLQAFDFNTNQQVSQPSPLGCSSTFTVSNIEPPVILQPVSGDSIRPAIPQNLIFSWTRPSGAPVNTQFNLKIIEVLPTDRNINDAMQSAGHPVFFETTVTATVFILGPADPQLVNGKKYAFAVIAIDPAGKAVFRNNGMSEVCSFVVKSDNSHVSLNQSPGIEDCKPNTLTQNSTIELIIWGKNLAKKSRFEFAPPQGIKVISTYFFNKQICIVTLKIDSLCNPGDRLIKVTNPDGSFGLSTSGFEIIAPFLFAKIVDKGKIDLGEPLKDSDGDGLPDIIDKCPFKPGPLENNGCPTGTIFLDRGYHPPNEHVPTTSWSDEVAFWAKVEEMTGDIKAGDEVTYEVEDCETTVTMPNSCEEAGPWTLKGTEYLKAQVMITLCQWCAIYTRPVNCYMGKYKVFKLYKYVNGKKIGPFTYLQYMEETTKETRTETREVCQFSQGSNCANDPPGFPKTPKKGDKFSRDNGLDGPLDMPHVK